MDVAKLKRKMSAVLEAYRTELDDATPKKVAAYHKLAGIVHGLENALEMVLACEKGEEFGFKD